MGHQPCHCAPGFLGSTPPCRQKAATRMGHPQRVCCDPNGASPKGWATSLATARQDSWAVPHPVARKRRQGWGTHKEYAVIRMVQDRKDGPPALPLRARILGQYPTLSPENGDKDGAPTKSMR